MAVPDRRPIAPRALPSRVRTLADELVAGLHEALGPRFAGAFLYGSVCFPPSAVADFDAHVLVDAPLTDADRAAVSALRDRLRDLPLGDQTDVYFVTVEDAAGREPPTHQLDPQIRDTSWALHRAHVHAGRFVALHGPDPRTIVPVPSWQELDEALLGELEWMDDRALRDARAYCVLQLCRILYSFQTRDVVVSKLQAGVWAHAAVDVDHHPMIRRAIAAYADGTHRMDDEVRGFHEEMRRRIEAARAPGA